MRPARGEHSTAACSRGSAACRGWTLVALLVAVGLLCGAAPALALNQRGHRMVASSFGAAGTGAGQFAFGGSFKVNEPAGVAVDEATGEVYVVDRGNHRVEVLGAGGEFVAAWGWGVSNGQERYEVCTSDCRAGLSGSHTQKGEFKEPGAIAVDNAPGGRGEVYVDMNAKAKVPDIERFPANGEAPLGKLPVKEPGHVDGIAFDREGRVWVYRAEKGEEGEEDGYVEGFSDGIKPASLGEEFEVGVECPKPGFAVDASGGSFYVDHELFSSEEECPAAIEVREEEEDKKFKGEGKEARPVVTTELNGGGVLSGSEGGIDRANTTGVAVVQGSGEGALGAAATGDVYIDNGTVVSAYTPAGGLIQRFGGGQLKQGEGIAVDAATGDVYVVDAEEEKVDVFEPEQPAAPVVDGLWAENLGPGKVTLSAMVNPEGADTHVYFQYGTVDCVSDPGGCTDVPAPPGVDIGGSDSGAGFGDRRVEATLDGLQAGTTYDYRVIANNPQSAEGEDRFATITTPPSPVGVLADGRAWEMVSPAEKDGSSIEPVAREGGLIQAAADGEAIAYAANGPVEVEPEGNRAPEPTQVLSVRGSSSWSSKDIATPEEKGVGSEFGEPAEYRFFTSDLSLSLVEPPGGQAEPREAPPLAPGASEKTLYLRDDPGLEPDTPERDAYAQAQANQGFRAPGYLPLVTPLTDTADPRTPFGGQLEFLDATADLRHVVLDSGEVSLMEKSAPGLYEWEVGGGLQLVSVLPDGLPAGEPEEGNLPELGEEGFNVRNAISSDGSRVFFYSTAVEEHSQAVEVHRLYMRDISDQKTIQLNAAQGVSEPAGESEELGSEVAFQGASSDGSRVFFTDTAPLTPESAQRPTFGSKNDPADLYECEIAEEAGQPTCKLRDLTPMPERGSAEVLNVVSGISEDGSSVYFVANGALTGAAKQGDCEAEGVALSEQRCNLYLWHEGTITLIARLSGEDSGDWGSLTGLDTGPSHIQTRPDLAGLTARVSPDGRYFAFMSDMPLTAYDNVDSNPEAKGARDQEVYVYDASSRLLVCASCNSRGPSVGVHDIEHSGKERGCWSIAAGTGRGSIWRARSRAGYRSASTMPSTSPAISPTVAGCSSTAPTISCRRQPTPRTMSMSTSPRMSAAAPGKSAACR